LAQKIVNDIAVQIFKPIREQMQGTLEKESMQRKTDRLEEGGLRKKQTKKIAPIDTTAYKTGESSVERRDVQEDPYRESI